MGPLNKARRLVAAVLLLDRAPNLAVQGALSRLRQPCERTVVRHAAWSTVPWLSIENGKGSDVKNPECV